MSNIDDLLAQLQKDKTVKSNVEEVKVVEEPKVKSTIPWLNIILIGTVIVMGYFLWSNRTTKDDVIPVNSVVEQVEKYENLYSSYKGQAYLKLADLVKQKEINNRVQLVKNAQAILEMAKKESLGKLDEMDNKFLPEESFEEAREEVIVYLESKSKGFEKAGK